MSGGQLSLSDDLARAIAPGTIEERIYARGYRCIAGADEVGRGPLAGPVVAASVIFPRGFSHPEIRDSKSLTSNQREELMPLIKRNAIGWGIGLVNVDEIDCVNILNASLRAMLKALSTLRPPPDCLLIDGNQIIPWNWLSENGVAFKVRPYQKAVVGGDQRCVSIAAASILAKVTRDALMVGLDKQYPEYGFARHKGYGSAAHLDALRRYGPCPVHRRSFKPVREICGDPEERILPLFVAEAAEDE